MHFSPHKITGDDADVIECWYKGADISGFFDSAEFYIWSTDGLTWNRPDFDVGTDNQVYTTDKPNMRSVTYLPGVLPGYRYIGIGSDESNSGLNLYASPDGTNGWAHIQQIMSDAAYGEHLEGKSIVARWYDGKYVAFYAQGHVADDRDIRAFSSDSLAINGAYSDEGVQINDGGSTDQKYELLPFLDCRTYLGFVADYDSVADLMDNIELYSSRKLLDDWTLLDATWMTKGTWGSDWDGGNIFAPRNLIKMDNEWWGYYPGRDDYHDETDTAFDTGLFKIGYRRIASVSGTDNITSETIGCVTNGRLLINGDGSGGYIKAELIDPSTGSAITGYDQSDSSLITTDTYETEITWSGSSLPENQQFRVKLYLSSAYLYSFSIAGDSALSQVFPAEYAAWDLDTNANDSSGNGNNLTVTGSLDYYGEIGADFDGTNDYCSTSDDGPSGDFSISCIFRCDTTGTAERILSNATSGTSGDSFQLSHTGTDTIAFVVYDGANYRNAATSASYVTANTWYHVIGTYNNTSGTASLYINGVLIDSNTATSGTMSGYSSPDVDVHVGCKGSDQTGRFNGFIGKVRLWDYCIAEEWDYKNIYTQDTRLTPERIPNDNLYAAFTFDDDHGFDYSGNQNDLTETGSVSYVAGRSGNCAVFDGTNDYFAMSNSGPTSSFSLMGWIYIEDSSTRQRVINTFENTATQQDFTFQVNSGSLQFTLWTAGAIYVNPSWSIASTNTWYHFVAVFDDSANTAYLYIDGALVDSSHNGSLGNYTSANQNLTIGAKASDGTEKFTGRLDEVAIYSEALSAADILWFYKQTKPADALYVYQH